MINIDYIMSLLDWNESSENQEKGIELAKEVECINVFIQPISKSFNKNVWDNCAKILSSKSDEELYPYLIEIFAWLQDLNWPGANIIYSRLIDFNNNEWFKSAINQSIKYSQSIDDVVWESNLKSLLNNRENITR